MLLSEELEQGSCLGVKKSLMEVCTVDGVGVPSAVKRNGLGTLGWDNLQSALTMRSPMFLGLL